MTSAKPTSIRNPHSLTLAPQGRGDALTFRSEFPLATSPRSATPSVARLARPCLAFHESSVGFFFTFFSATLS
jgi:hypothetical protein